MKTTYKYMPPTTRNIAQDNDNLVVAINKDDLEKDEYRFYWYGHISHRGNMYHVEGHIIFLPFASADGELMTDKYENGTARFIVVRGASSGKLVYFNLNKTDRNIYEGILTKLFSYTRKLIIGGKVINEADLVAINNLAYDTEVKASKAMIDLEDAKAKLQIAELNFIRANNQYVRFTGKGELFDESLAG